MPNTDMEDGTEEIFALLQEVEMGEVTAEEMAKVMRELLKM